MCAHKNPLLWKPQVPAVSTEGVFLVRDTPLMYHCRVKRGHGRRWLGSRGTFKSAPKFGEFYRYPELHPEVDRNDRSRDTLFPQADCVKVAVYTAMSTCRGFVRHSVPAEATHALHSFRSSTADRLVCDITRCHLARTENMRTFSGLGAQVPSTKPFNRRRRRHQRKRNGRAATWGFNMCRSEYQHSPTMLVEVEQIASYRHVSPMYSRKPSTSTEAALTWAFRALARGSSRFGE